MYPSIAPDTTRLAAVNPGTGGFSLVEMLVATVIFSLGLGGLSLMMLTSVHGTLEARDETVAVAELSSLAELILMNPASVGHLVDASGSCAAPDGCPEADWATGNLEQWQVELEQNLALATSLVCRDSSPEDGEAGNPACDGAGATVVKIFWTDPHHLAEVESETDGRGSQRRAILELPE